MLWIALLRAVNVGGKNSLPMAELRGLMKDSGFAQVRTYIQTGNLIFESAGASAEDTNERIASLIEENFAFRPAVLSLTISQLEKIAAENPYPAADPKSLQLFFLHEQPESPDLAKLEELKTASELFSLEGRPETPWRPDAGHFVPADSEICA